MFAHLRSVSGENVAGVDFGGDVGEFRSGAVGEDGLREAFEFVEVVDHTRAEECRAVFKSRFVDNYGCAFGLDALHNALD